MSETMTGPAAPQDINRRDVEDATMDLAGIGELILDLATIIEDEGKINPRSLYFLGREVIARSEWIMQATGLASEKTEVTA